MKALESDLWEKRPVRDPQGEVYEMLRRALEEHRGIAAKADAAVAARRKTLAEPTYNRIAAFDLGDQAAKE